MGREPQPGLAQLRLVKGRIDAAAAAIRRAVDEVQGRLTRSRLLPAYVEIMLAAGDSRAARAGAEDLSQLAADLKTPLLRAVAAHATGHVLLVEGDARAALAELRLAFAAWQQLEAPYDAARVRVLIGLACRALGDEDTAALEWEAARGVFAHLGAAPDLAHLDSSTHHATSRHTHALTPRELQVLRLLATGETNKAIAAELVVSERTVDRHVSNILAKLGVPSRAAATAYAYQHQLL